MFLQTLQLVKQYTNNILNIINIFVTVLEMKMNEGCVNKKEIFIQVGKEFEAQIELQKKRFYYGFIGKCSINFIRIKTELHSVNV